MMWYPEVMSSDQFLHAMAARLQADGATVGTGQLAHGPALVGLKSQFKWRWMATKLHLFTVAVAVPLATRPLLEQFSHDALTFGNEQKGSLRGLQVGVAAIPILVAQAVDPSGAEYARTQLIRKFGALAWPAIFDLSTGTVHSHQGAVMIGGIYAGYLRQQTALAMGVPHA